jgi:hypothetical protein
VAEDLYVIDAAWSAGRIETVINNLSDMESFFEITPAATDFIPRITIF